MLVSPSERVGGRWIPIADTRATRVVAYLSFLRFLPRARQHTDARY